MNVLNAPAVANNRTITPAQRPVSSDVPLTFHECHFTLPIHRAVLTTSPSQPAAFRLQNTDGFWELLLDGASATLSQDQALFYVAYLMAHQPAEPIAAIDLAAAVAELFIEHEDFVQAAPTIWCKGDRAEALRLLRRRERALHQILDSPDALDPVKSEALDELLELELRQQEHMHDFAGAAQRSGELIWASLIKLYNSLALAVDVRGQPHPLIRKFARHLLVHLLMPSRRASRALGSAYFTYQL